MDLQTFGTLIGVIVGVLSIFKVLYDFIESKKKRKQNAPPNVKIKDPEANVAISSAISKTSNPDPVTLNFMAMMQQGKYQEAVALAELERNQLLSSLSAKESIDKQLELDYFDVWHARALIYTGETNDAIRKLDEIIIRLEKEKDDSHRRFRKNLILGQAHNDKGYANWMILGHYRIAIQEFKAAIHYISKQNKQGDQLATSCDNLGRVYSQLGYRTKAELLIEYGRSIRSNLGENKNNRYALSLVSSAITSSQYGDPYRAMELSSDALRWFTESNKRGKGLAYLIQGQSKRYIGSNWKYQRFEDRKSSRDYLEKSLASLQNAEAIFKDAVIEPIRLLQVYNEMGCTQREISQMEADNNNEEEAIRRSGYALEMLQKSLDIAHDKKYEVAYVDGCEDLARLYKNYQEIDAEEKNRKKWGNRAHEMLTKAEAIIERKSPNYFIRKNNNDRFIEDQDCIEDYWQQLGKIHMLRGHIIFDTENRPGYSIQKGSKRALVKAMENYALAMGYFGRFLMSAENEKIKRVTNNSFLMNHRFFSKELYERLRNLDAATIKEINNDILPKIIKEYDLENEWIDWLYKDVVELILQMNSS